MPSPLGTSAPAQVANALQWQRLSMIRSQLQANCAALAQRDPALAERISSHIPSGEYVLAVQGDKVILGLLEGTTVRVRPTLQTAANAHHTLSKVYPSGNCTEPLLVAGVDQGWLWGQAYQMPISVPPIPGYRPPLYFLEKNIEALWIALHLHDWRTMLADRRVRLMVGADVVEQLKRHLVENHQCPDPKLALTIGESLWPAGGLQGVLDGYRAELDKQYRELEARYPDIYRWATPQAIAQKFRDGQPLRILGITSRHTTFLQYSMRDWLAGFARLGHQTHLLIEQGSHELLNTLSFAETITRFQPDLVLMIDHYRNEYGGLPRSNPFVMWVQDMLPSIFCEKAGAAQGPMDFCLGFGRLQLSTRYGYPASRYMASRIGVNEERFDRSPPTEAQLAKYRCEVSYVSHASTPATALLQKHIDRQSPEGKRFFVDVYEQMNAHYESGGLALSEVAIRLLIENSAQRQQVSLPEEDIRTLAGFFNNEISNALFRHQTLEWLADLNVDLHIYGRGWEQHPRLSRFAKGVADNITELGAIYRASKINIQVTPHGAVHQRLLDGLAVGGFFLLRYHPGDAVGPIYQELWAWCRQHHIANNEQLYARADARIEGMIARINELETSPASRREMSVFDVMNGHRDSDFMTSAASIWPEYPQVAFNTRQELDQQLRHFLSNPEERQCMASTMRQAMIERASYTSISRRLLGFIADELAPATALAA